MKLWGETYESYYGSWFDTYKSYGSWSDTWLKSLPSNVSITISPNTEPILRFHNGNSISVNEDITSMAERIYKELYESPAWEANNPALKNKKENEDMPKIVNYKYNEETGTTTLFWADKTQTTVTADNLTEANQFEGFCAACAKKLFGNKSTYLNQFDK